MNKLAHIAQRGFTLVELTVVVVIIGILSAVLVPVLKGTSDPAKATGYIKAADGVNQVLTTIAQSCNVSTTVASNPLPDSTASRTLSDVIFGGSSYVASDYTTCYNQSGAKPLTEISKNVSAGVYSVQGSTVSLAGGGTAPLQVTFADVKDEIVLLMVQKFQTVTSLAASDTSHPVIRYGTATDNRRSVTLLKQ